DLPSDDSETESGFTGPARISSAAASATALAEVPGGIVTDLEREVEYGVDAYEVSVEAPDGRALEVSVDVQTGAVVHIGEDE
ncbi:MAG: PepSY domain-containing protein, partial [Miltoncostaeaceae bacterium]